MKNCPICCHEVGSYHEVTHTNPYMHENTIDGIRIYGKLSARRETICYSGIFFHFALYDFGNNLVEHRLVKLGVENTATKSPTDEFWDAWNEDDQEWNELDEWEDEDDDMEYHSDGEDELF